MELIQEENNDESKDFHFITTQPPLTMLQNNIMKKTAYYVSILGEDFLE